MNPICLPFKCMTIGGLLDGQIIPCTGVCIVRPSLHTGEQILFALWQPTQDTVDHCHRFCTGDCGIRAERAIHIAIDPAQCSGTLNEFLRPMPMDVGEAFSAFYLGMVKASTYCCKFSTSDWRIGVKDLCGAPLHNVQSGVEPNCAVSYISYLVTSEKALLSFSFAARTSSSSNR